MAETNQASVTETPVPPLNLGANFAQVRNELLAELQADLGVVELVAVEIERRRGVAVDATET